MTSRELEKICQSWALKTLKEPLVRKLLPRAGSARTPGLHTSGAGGAKPAPLEISVISGPKMKDLNLRYRGKDYATDVLSFPAPQPLQKMGVLGELILCASVITRQAREQRHTPRVECAILVVHGLLHLLGFDHERSAPEARKMLAQEKRILALLGIRRDSLIGRVKV